MQLNCEMNEWILTWLHEYKKSYNMKKPYFLKYSNQNYLFVTVFFSLNSKMASGFFWKDNLFGDKTISRMLKTLKKPGRLIQKNCKKIKQLKATTMQTFVTTCLGWLSRPFTFLKAIQLQMKLSSKYRGEFPLLA